MKRTHLAAVAATIAGAILSAGSPAQAYTSIVPDHTVRWDACEGPITWSFDGATAQSLDAMTFASLMIEGATGLDLQYAPNAGDAADVTITFGSTGSRFNLAWTTDTVAPDGYIDHAVMTVNPSLKPKAFKSHRGRARRHVLLMRNVFMHELGHVVGLGHTPGNSSSVMNEYASERIVWSADDLEGLASVSAQAC